jgi:hypothetical protein
LIWKTQGILSDQSILKVESVDIGGILELDIVDMGMGYSRRTQWTWNTQDGHNGHGILEVDTVERGYSR